MARAVKDHKSVLVSALVKGRYVVDGLEFLELPNIGLGDDLITISCTTGSITVIDTKNELLEFFTTDKKTAFNVLKKVKDAELNYAACGNTFSIHFPLKSLHKVAQIAKAERKP